MLGFFVCDILKSTLTIKQGEIEMSLTDKSTKDNYIKLIVSVGREPEEVSSETLNEKIWFKEIDITDKLMGEVNEIDNHTIRGIRWQMGNTGNTQVVADLKRLKDMIDWEAERIFDACIVNEKQKKAIKELFNTRMYDAFNRDWKDLEFATALLKQNKK